MNTAKILLVGLDACDPATAQRFAAEGIMPNLARLLKTASRAPVTVPHGVFVGSLWANFSTCVRPDRHRWYCWEENDPRTYERKIITPNVHAFPTFWRQISDAGRRVIAIDVPHTKCTLPLNGIEIEEWGCHDKHFGLHASSPDLIDYVEREIGFHPILTGERPFEVRDCCPDDEAYRQNRFRTLEENRLLLEGLVEGVERKRKLVSLMLARQDWDLCVAIFGESHAVGHQLWHLHDREHPRFDEASVHALGGDPVAQVYSALDRALGQLEAEAGADHLLVFLSHGMGAHHDGTHLLEEVLVRLDAHNRAEADLRVKLWRKLKWRIAPLAGAADIAARKLNLPESLRNGIASAMGFGPLSEPEWRANRPYFQAPNNTVYGGVRINLKGREPRGRVAPENLERVIGQLEQDLKSIVNVATGKSIVRGVERCGDYHKRAPDDALPDLFVDWDHSAPIETVTSPKIGVVHVPYDHWRTGDHKPSSLLLAKGSDMPDGVRLKGFNVEDIGVSLAARLGVALIDIDGAPCDWLAGSTEQIGESARSA